MSDTLIETETKTPPEETSLTVVVGITDSGTFTLAGVDGLASAAIEPDKGSAADVVELEDSAADVFKKEVDVVKR